MDKAIAVDFDGTLCEFAYPKIGEPNYRVIEALKKEQKNGAKLILWTCREGKLLEEAISWSHENGIEFDAVNDCLESWKEAYGNNPRKVGANEYWDDRSFNPFVGSKAKLGCRCTCHGYLSKVYDGVFIEHIGGEHTKSGEDCYIIHDAEERKALMEGRQFESKTSECEGSYDAEKTYYRRVEKKFDGVIVGTKEVVTEGYIGVDTDCDPFGREHTYCFKEPKTKVKCALVYFANCKSRLVPLEDLEVNILE